MGIRLVRILHCVSTCLLWQAQRHRNDRNMWDRNASTIHSLKSGKKSVHVCKTFCAAPFGLTNDRLSTVEKVKDNGDVLKGKQRENENLSVNCEVKGATTTEKIQAHIPFSKSVAKLHHKYNQKSARKARLSYDMFRNVFMNDFNIGSSSPTCDVCS